MTSDYYYDVGAENETYSTDVMAGGTTIGGSCWWRFFINSTIWDTSVSKYAVYVMANQYTWVYAGVGSDRQTVADVKILTSVNKYTFASDQYLYLAAVPISRSVYTSFYVNISVDGELVSVDKTFHSAFWKKVSGFIILIFFFFVFLVATWLYYQKYGNFNLCRRLITCKPCRESKLCNNLFNKCFRKKTLDKVVPE